LTTSSKGRSQSPRYCNPNCQYFKCSKRALGPKKKIRGRFYIVCNFVEGDLCTGSRCTYSYCAKRKLRPDGTCGLYGRSQPKENDDLIEEKYERELIQKEKEANRYQSYLKEKYRRKLKGAKW